MGRFDSRLDPAESARARTLLTPPVRRDRMWPALIAATALALASILFASIAVFAPPVQTEHVADAAPD